MCWPWSHKFIDIQKAVYNKSTIYPLTGKKYFTGVVTVITSRCTICGKYTQFQMQGDLIENEDEKEQS